jgi:phosphatidylinositol dimannoside acyltransferase
VNAKIYLWAWRILRFIPTPLIKGFSAAIAPEIYRRNSRAIQTMKKNYQQLHPQISEEQLGELVKAGIKSYLRYWVEVFTLNSWSKKKILNSVVSRNEEILEAAIAANRGVIVAITHSANWDLAGAYFSLTRSKIVTVAEELEPRELFEKFVAYREKLGMEIFPLQQRTLARLMVRAREKNIIALLADRDLTVGGVPVEIAEKETSIPAGPALIAYETSAVLLTAAIYYGENGKMVVEFEPEIKIPTELDRSETVAKVSQIIADRFTKSLRAHTVDWHMMQKVWGATK